MLLPSSSHPTIHYILFADQAPHPMNVSFLSRAAVLLALAAAPAAAQTPRAVITGFDNLRWGAARDTVTRYWRETPQSETTERGMTFMRFVDWEGMQWTVAVHERQGFSHFLAKSVPTLAAERCPRVFEQYVRRMQRRYDDITPQGGENNPGAGNLCEEVRAGRASARYTWTDPVNNAGSSVYIDPADGRVVFTQETAFFRDWRAQRDQPAAQAQAQPPAPAPAAPPAAAAPAGYDSRLWNPREPAVQIPFGASRQDVVRAFGEPVLEDTRNVGPDMVDLIYSRGGQGVVFTVHRTRGMIRASNSTGLVGADEPCNAFWQRMRGRVAALFPGVTPRGGAHNPRGGDLCQEVQAGRAFAEMVWPTPDGGSVWLRVGPSSGAISVAVSSADYHRWFDTSAEGRERAERVRRAAGTP
jgi:hypothetical protein